MQSMASVNRLIGRVGIPLILAAYLAFLYWDSQNTFSDGGRQQILENHLDHISSSKDVKGIVFGGSNSYFSLSAELMSQSRSERWYNASLIDEGYSSENLHGFMRQLASRVEDTRITSVVYSTVYVYRAGDIKKRAANKLDLVGRSELSLKPNRAAFSHLKAYLLGETHTVKQYPPPTNFGDIPFDKVNCVFPEDHLHFEREDVEVAADFLYETARVLANRFPNAKVYMVLPSEFYGSEYNALLDGQFKNAIGDAFFERVNDDASIKADKVKLVFQSNYPSFDLVCDGRHHANLTGRQWRTQELLKSLN
jgi:hypothetical protein